jgi:lipopolysaccharide/colanic/teichoic acid biosynthesis glycosyltransferase
MQIETLQNPASNEVKSYLRVATISSKTALCYVYVGANQISLNLLQDNFKSGFSVSDLDAAKRLLSSDENHVVDAIILDIPYDDKSVKAFYYFLKNRSLDSIPIIYNESFLLGASQLRHEFIDDVIDLTNWQFDFYNKISFLKKSKSYILSNSKKQSDDEPKRTVIKRMIDIILASVLIILLSPIFLLIALAIKIESRGPVFYNANRAGRGFRIFKFFKFRTMEVNADKKVDALAHLNQYGVDNMSARFFKISNDPRITKVGRFLRNTSLDELPQLFNVLKGDMSLVGNRPLPLYEAATLTTNEFVERFMAPAGITGLWQIKKRGKSAMSVDERIELDISYARKSNLMYDFWIMVKTPGALFQKTDV